MKKFLIPIIFSAIILFLLDLLGIHNSVKWLTNDFYIEAFQTSSKRLGQSNDKIVIVNISDFPPEVIKDQIYILSQYHPAVIGLDYYLTDSLNPGGQLIGFEYLVLPMRIDQTIPHSILISSRIGSIPSYPVNQRRLDSNTFSQTFHWWQRGSKATRKDQEEVRCSCKGL